MGFEMHLTSFPVRECDFRMEAHRRRFAVNESSHAHASAQETNLFRHFAEQVLSGLLNPMWPEAAPKNWSNCFFWSKALRTAILLTTHKFRSQIPHETLGCL